MTSRLATIEKIHSIQPHFNADTLEVGKIKEWPVVVKKGQYKDGDFIVFIRIDSIVPFTNTYFAFMERQHYRVWNAKFRGAPSQGLVCPTEILGSGYTFMNDREELFMEGDDVTDVLGVTKYEKGLDASIVGDAKGGFPTHLVSITDEDNLLNYPEVLPEFLNVDVYITIKADGSSMTVINDGTEIHVCSRRLEQKEGTGFWKIADKYDLPNKLKTTVQNIAIQAEACGGKIQANPLGLAEQAMFVFNIKDISTGEWFGWNDIKELCCLLGIPTVRLACEPFKFDETWNIARLQELANSVTYTSVTGQVKKGEGIVLRPLIPKYSAILGKALSVKILNQEYK